MFTPESSESTVSGPSLKELENSETMALEDSRPLPDTMSAVSGNTVALSGTDPFAAGGDPFGGGDSANPFGGGGDPFASSMSAAEVAPDPTGVASDSNAGGGDAVDFGALLSGGSGGGSEDPFGGGTSAPADTGFGGENPANTGDPFGGGGADPFASGGAPADPFGGGGADPFGGAGDDNPFASGGDDPFGGGGDPFGGESDPFGGGADPFGGSDPFGADPDTVVLPGGSGGSDSLFGGDADADEDSLFLATPSTSGAMFDEEDEDEHDSFGGVVAPTPKLDLDAPTTPPKAAAAKKGGAGGVVAPLLIVALGIVGADYLGYLDLGIGKALKSMIDGKDEDAEARKRKAAAAASLVKPVELDDSLEKYLQEVQRLTKVAALSPQDMLVRKLLVDRLLDVYERFPGLFDREPKYRKQLEDLAAQIPTPPRYGVLKDLAESKLEGLEAKLRALLAADGVVADDYGVAALGMLDLNRAERTKHALVNPGQSTDPTLDPRDVPQPNDRLLALARQWLDKGLALAKSAPNAIKFQYYDARLRVMMGDYETVVSTATSLLEKYPEHNRLRLLLATAHVETNHLGKAAELLRIASEKAVEQGKKADLAIVYHVEARLEGKRGRPEDQLTAMQGVLKLRPNDELMTIRTARLMLQQKHAQECQKLLVAGKKKGMKSIAFEVALVDFWLWANRTEDALEEIKVATKLYPDTIELLYLRGQIEDRQQHYATARDYFAKVIARQPKHQRAVVRLAQLQSQAGRHDDALLTLQTAVKRLGENEALLEPMADELYTLKRMKEARETYGKLLKKQPSNKKYLINAARIDMDNGQVDRALRYMRMLRDDGNLDQAGALQMAEALVLKKQHSEAAKTIVPFAEKEPNNVAMNTLAGKALLDSGQIDLAKTFLERAHGVAQRQGGNSETLFHYGRLAFAMDRVKQGIARLQQAIKAAPEMPYYRYYLGRELMKRASVKSPETDDLKLRKKYKEEDERRKELGKVAVREMKWLVLHARRFANLNKPLTYLDDVHRQIGRHYISEKRYEDAIPHLQESVKINSRHVETLGLLGMALFKTNDKEARTVLRRVTKLSPHDPVAALYLGLIALQAHDTTTALKWLQKAAKSSRKEVVESHFQIALIYRERRQKAQSKKAMRRFLKRAPKDHPFREEAIGILEDLR